jgi:hypothetical protein
MKRLSLNEIKKKRQEEFMADLDNPKQLPLIAEEIQARMGGIRKHMYQIGKLLNDAKLIIGHGNFQGWIEENFEFSYQTANNFMNVYKHCLNQPKLIHSMKSSVLYTITSPQFPEDLREHIFENADRLKEINNSKIREIMEKFKAEEIDFDSPEIKGLMKYNEDKKDFREDAKMVDDCIEIARALLEDLVKKVEAINWPTDIDGTLKVTKNQKKEFEWIIENMKEAIYDAFPEVEKEFAIKPSLQETIKEYKQEA